MFSSLYVYAGAFIAILFLVSRIVRHFNAPKTIEQQRLAQEAKAKADDEKRADLAAKVDARRKWWILRRSSRRKKP